MPKAALDILDQEKVTNRYKRGQFVFYQGNRPAGLYCVNGGVVRLETEGPQGNGHILRMVKSGGILGYRSLLSDEPYRASAVVHEDALVCFIPRTSIFALFEKFPDVTMKLLSVVSEELRSAEDRLCAMTDKNAAQRVAEALLFLKDNFAQQTWTRKEIAEWAGTTPETVMRTLADFEDEGLISLQGRKITVKERKKLIERADPSL